MPITIAILKWQLTMAMDDGNIRGMSIAAKKEEPLQITIDKFGRVVIPQKVREELGLSPGSKMEVALETDDKVVLKVVHPEPVIKRINGIMVMEGPKTDFDIVEHMKKQREERIKHTSGLDR